MAEFHRITLDLNLNDLNLIGVRQRVLGLTAGGFKRHLNA